MAAMTLLIVMGASAWAANTKQNVTQVTSAVTLTADVDYCVSSSTPFGANGVVNIANTEHAVLILEGVKPSLAIPMLEGHVNINGVQAVDGKNCQVKLYNRGTIIMPYASSIKPLTVYSEQNFEGEQCNDFGLENSGGFMNTLTTKKLNNRIRSFKLKRGYMVTFSNRAQGKGYNRCFIADDADLEVPVLPAILDKSISSYRVFQWYDTGKQALANDTRAGIVNQLNVTSCYSFGPGESRLPDAECVPHHIHEGWPAPSALGSATYSCHMKTNNEPGNSADPEPCNAAAILANWEQLMATGMRLCSPSTHDGSEGLIREVLDSIDARGWRCDIIDIHCYWNEWNFYNMIKGWTDRYKRPVWISEWIWGSSWSGGQGIFNYCKNPSNPTQDDLNKNREVVQNICNALNSYDYVERYFYWNSENTCSRLVYDDGTITPAGQMYSKINSGLAYNGKYNYIPKVPKQYDPSGLSIEFDKKSHTAKLSWHEPNGEMNRAVYVERRANSNKAWAVVTEVERKEQAANYTFEDNEAMSGYEYRIRVIDGNDEERTTKAVMAVSNEMGAGDAVTVGSETMYLGGNILTNGDFDMGLTAWTDGTGQPLSSEWFYVVPVGGNDGGSYLQALGDGGMNTVSAVKTFFDIQPNTYYYFSGSTCNTTKMSQSLNLCESETATSDKFAAMINNSAANWNTKFTTFNSENYPKAVVKLRTMGCQAQIDQLILSQLFATQEEAWADGIVCARKKAETFKTYNTLLPQLNNELDMLLTSVPVTANDATSLASAEHAVANALQAHKAWLHADSLIMVAEAVLPYQLHGAEELAKAVADMRSAEAAADIISAEAALQQALNDYFPLTNINANTIKSYKFSSTQGWTTKCGTYKGGDQRTNSQDGVTFWNAWWSGVSASEGTAQTMEVKQAVSGLEHGLYVLACKASTQHYCLSDQHAYLTDGTTTTVSPNLTADYFDLPTVDKSDRWQTLTTLPIYVDDDGQLTVGFTGSKQGAVDNAWKEIGNADSKGDKREGWWCATEFLLKRSPLYRTTVVPNEYGVICLPFGIRSSEKVQLYELVGITDDYQNLCLRETDEVEAGVPCIYKSTTAQAEFHEFGTATSAAGQGAGGLWGNLREAQFYTSDDYVLQNGVWQKIGDNMPDIPNYSAILSVISDQLPLRLSWDGLTMPINGVSEDEKKAIAEGIGHTTVQPTAQPSGIYTVDGRSISRQQATGKGIYIKVVDGRAYKVIKN